GEQYLFVNQRFIKSNYFNHAIAKAYEDLIDPQSFPSYFIMMEVEPDRIDVNIHPTKTEIKFQDERALYQLIQASVKKALGVFNVKPSINFETPAVPLSPVSKNQEFKVPPIHINPSYNPFKKQAAGSTPSAEAPRKLKELYDIEQEFQVDWKKEEAVRPTEHVDEREIERSQENNNIPKREEEQVEEAYLQIAQSYILTKIKSGFILIDQQRAHERVLFERYLSKLAGERKSSQQQLFPERIQLGAKDVTLLSSCKETLEAMGFQFEFFSSDEIVVNALPEGLMMSGVSAFMDEFLEHMHAPKLSKSFGYQEKLAYSLALSGSIKKGRVLKYQEMQSLVGDLFACTNPKLSPSGKTCTVQIGVEEIEKLFNG
ncbi:MAG: hypothetical protein ACPF8V_04565, partial [Luteibaculum sp.]